MWLCRRACSIATRDHLHTTTADTKDTYQQQVRKLIEAKRADTTIEKAVPPPRSTAVADLMDALRTSVEEASAARRSRE
jgi:DNA end-binding protein Ku